jgi:hypothetical protein
VDAQLGGREFYALSDGLTGGLQRIIPNGNTVALDTAATNRFGLMLERDGFGARVTAGFLEGFADGFVDGAKRWMRELSAYLVILGRGFALTFEELWDHPLASEDQAAGLAPETRAALQQLRSLQLMRQVIRWLGSVGPAEAFDALREAIPTAEEVGLMIGHAIAEWLSALVRLAPDDVAVGRKVGRLFGRVFLEMIRGVLEPQSVSIGLTATGLVADVEAWE